MKTASYSYTDEQLDELDAMERAWLHTLPVQRTIKQLMELYPTGKTAAMRATRKRIKDIQGQISSLSEVRDVWSNWINTQKPKDQPGYIDYLNDLIERHRNLYEDEIKKYERDLRYLKSLGEPSKSVMSTPKGGVTEDQIARARETAIKDIITVFRGNKAVCLWHDDQHPSMHVYGTRVHCFVCGTHADAIDVYMVANTCDFVTAVKALS